ncbi:MAG: hypothetical protein IKD14_02485 [Clostridia bacterium]|nr:hypothetical protein [Clostridia bacterium]
MTANTLSNAVSFFILIIHFILIVYTFRGVHKGLEGISVQGLNETEMNTLHGKVYYLPFLKLSILNLSWVVLSGLIYAFDDIVFTGEEKAFLIGFLTGLVTILVCSVVTVFISFHMRKKFNISLVKQSFKGRHAFRSYMTTVKGVNGVHILISTWFGIHFMLVSCNFIQLLTLLQ